MAFQIVVLFFISYSTIIVVSGQTQPPEDCLTNCTNVFYQSGSHVDPVSMLNLQSKLSNGTIVDCPQMNDSVKLEKSCKPYRAAKQCIDTCPESDAKTNILHSLSGLQFMCIDRIDDWKGYTPCLSEHCVQVQDACDPKCGSFYFILKQVVDLLRQANDNRYARPGNATTLDLGQFGKVFADSCSRIYCLNDCSREMVRNFCGNGALNLGEDIMWTTLSSMFYSLRQFGVNVEWPIECKNLAINLRKRL